jgi:hypothetical protein
MASSRAYKLTNMDNEVKVEEKTQQTTPLAKSEKTMTQVPWLTPVIPATQEAEVRRIVVQSQS